ncbi:bacillithiol system protein YtxJ [Reichenbachiella faecimaris]|uniref:Bacillithiol system protein YtxJ n=1 Tax=Reichenbachiella faecimaris TaxID=692418 RepID=A0A1W2GB07_REIFA|nr:bacillithiol system redox-active protein YtxJ [Reichenbachiella faecimaris]SMD33803.1 bacillithiol system protein YtxJ [Reichenbachiella faecimaris]
MNWNHLTAKDQIDQIKASSADKPVLIFKHSTRCSISAMAENRLERAWNTEEIPSMTIYHLDLIQHRDLSDEIAISFSVPHESPQVLIISDGVCVYHNSHMGIAYHEIKRVFDGLVTV